MVERKPAESKDALGWRSWTARLREAPAEHQPDCLERSSMRGTIRACSLKFSGAMALRRLVLRFTHAPFSHAVTPALSKETRLHLPTARSFLSFCCHSAHISSQRRVVSQHPTSMLERH